MKSDLATDWKNLGEPQDDKKKEISILDAIKISTMSASGLAALGLPPREGVLGDWLKVGDLGFIFAPRGLGKTWLSAKISSAIANGGMAGPWIAHKPRKVLYIDGEMALDGMLERMDGMQSGENLLILNHEVLFHLGSKTLNLADPSTQYAFNQYFLEIGAEVLVCDNLSSLCVGVEENNSDDWEQILQWLLSLRRLKIAVIIVHHAGRNGEMRGTSRREDAAFWVLKLDHPDEGKSGTSRMAKFISKFTKERNSGFEQAPLQWTFETDSNNLIKVSYTHVDHLTIFRSWLESGLSDATSIAGAMDVSVSHVSKLAKKAVGAGWLKITQRKYVLVSNGPV